VVFEREQLTYRELNRRANQLAHYLRKLGVGPEVLVGICLERSLEMVIGLLGILKAGGAYVPLDPAYPSERLSFMLKDARVEALLTTTALLSGLPKLDIRVVCLDMERDSISRESEVNLVQEGTPEGLAYVIYTSGSTGRPKGALITHQNVVRLFLATDEWFRFNERDVWTLFHSYAFDFSVWELWGALIYGGRLVVVPYLVSRSPKEFYELLVRERVTVLNQTPSAFRQLIEAGDAVGQKDLALRYVIFGGEALEMRSLRPWYERHGDGQPQLVNMYGITETTVHVTYRPLSERDLTSGSIIGIPIPDVQVYILNAGQLVPVGVPGEMFVGGEGLGRGYLNRPELTAERFIPNPFGQTEGERLYRTGDLARYLPDGSIEFLGRIDQQVKIRGFRIELGEIETILGDHPQVVEAIVAARENGQGEKRLVAYVVPEQGQAATLNELRSFLKQKLPDYMVPSTFVFLDVLPLTPNGKVDRKALPEPDDSRPELIDGYVAPSTPIEKALAEMWMQVLDVEKVGIHDNFFDLGGHSLLAMQLISRVRNSFQIELSVRSLFDAPTVAGLEMVVVNSLIEQTEPEETTQILH
jgi:amino acid adenylation domain-containing protein